MVASTGSAQELALEEGEAVLLNLVELPMPEPVAAGGAGSAPSLDEPGRHEVFALLALRRPIGARALGGPEVYGVDASAGAAGDAPDPGSYASDLLEVLLSKGDPSGEAGGWVRRMR